MNRTFCDVCDERMEYRQNGMELRDDKHIFKIDVDSIANEKMTADEANFCREMVDICPKCIAHGLQKAVAAFVLEADHEA